MGSLTRGARRHLTKTTPTILPSTDLKASAPRTIAFTVLNSPAHPCRYRRFACPLTGANARLAEKRGSVTPSFQGTCTPYLLPVRLAHQTLGDAFMATQYPMLSSPRRPDSTIRIFSSAE